MIMKNVPAYSNKDNKHCLQSCIRSILEYSVSNKKFTKNYIDSKTIFNNGWSWLPPSIVWLNSLGLKVKLYSIFNYAEFASKGEEYLLQFKGQVVFSHEKSNGAYNQINKIRESTKEMISKGYWVNKILEDFEIRSFLSKQNNLALGKTVYEWLEGKFIIGASHYVLILESDQNNDWIVHDPGKPLKKYRLVHPKINDQKIFGDIVLIEK